MELVGVPQGPATGIVIESTLDKGRGPVSTILVQEGRLSRGDILLCGEEYGRVRALFDEQGNQIDCAGPSCRLWCWDFRALSTPVNRPLSLKSDRKAREVAEVRKGKTRDSKLAAQQSAKLENIFNQMQEGATETINILVKADVQGSAEALRGRACQALY